MTQASPYKKELYSLPKEVVDELVAFVKASGQKKSHVVSDAIREYLARRKQQKLIDEALDLIGSVHTDTPLPDIQEIKADRYAV